MTRQLSIAFLSHLASPDSPTGAEHSLAVLAGGLVRSGHRVLVVAPGPWALEPRLRESGAEVRIRRCRALWLTGWDPVTVPVAVAKWTRFAAPPTGEAALVELLRGWCADVVHVNCLPHVHGARAARRAGIPVVWHLREILPPGARRRWFARRLDALAREIVAVSEAVAGWVRAEGLEDRLSVVHNGVPESISEPLDPAGAREAIGIPADGIVAGLYGQVLPHKGVLDLVRAGRAALSLAPELRFVIAGSGPSEFLERVRAEIGSAGDVAARFHLLPPRGSSAELLAASDIACLCTTTPDPLPRTVLEAMAAGLPVAAFRSGGTSEMVVDGTTGLLVDVGDTEGLARALARLAGDAALRASMGAAGRARASESFSVQRHLGRMEEVLARAVGR
jgi:glycosyltransferase involved in cell wall biosynthesis